MFIGKINMEITLCHCFEQDEKQAKHFAENVDGTVKYEY